MNGEHKITSSHRERAALIYLRQSSMAQVREHTESTKSQYALAGKAAALGWARSDIEVIDTDLGISGKWGVARKGFTELVTRVCAGDVGAIFGIEITRLARSNADVARLAERSPGGTPASLRTGNGFPQPGCDQDDKSRMNREVHVRILWEPGGESPPGYPTRCSDLAVYHDPAKDVAVRLPRARRRHREPLTITSSSPSSPSTTGKSCTGGTTSTPSPYSTRSVGHSAT